MPPSVPGAKMTSFTQDIINRIAGLNPFGGGQTKYEPAPSPSSDPPPPSLSPVTRSGKREPWFGPGEPMRTVAPRQDVAGRAYDFPTTINMGTQRRQYEGISFEMLRQLADFDMVRMCVETRKDQMSKLEWAILPRLSDKNEVRGAADDRCKQLKKLLEYPDNRYPWVTWKRLLLEEQLVLDAPAIYVRRNLGGEIYSLEIVDGATIKPLLDETGRMPLSPKPAYQQVLKGMAAINYTADELVYLPRNPTANRVYGRSPVEQIILTVNVAIRREVARLAYFTEGNIPDALISVPKEWTPDQIARFQDLWDTVLTDPNSRKRARFVPGDMQYQPTRSDTALMDTFDEWLARVICFCFSLPPLPFVRQQNKSTAETAYTTAVEEGLQPMMVWFKSVMDYIIQRLFKYDDLEFIYDPVEKIDPGAEQERNMRLVQSGIMSADQMLARMGLPGLGMPNAIWGGPNGVIFIDDLLKAKEQGLTAIQPPPQPMQPGDPNAPQDPNAQLMGSPGYVDGAGSPSPPQGPSVQDALAGVPASVLAAVGLGPDGTITRKVDVTQEEHDAGDPLAHLVPHPQVLRTLRSAESRFGKGAR